MNLYYFNRRWSAVYGYLLVAMTATPWLPLLIEWTSSKWSEALISRLLLGVEISIGVLLIISAGAIFFFNARKFACLALIIGEFTAFVRVLYLVIPNPYELTHLPEYAILGALVIHALKRDMEGSEKAAERSLYFRSAVITGLVGIIDELYQGLLLLPYFAWYDVLLNGVGGLSGLTLARGISRDRDMN